MSLQYSQDIRGIALLAGLVMLAAISLLALVATSSMVLQRRMAANHHEQQHSLSAASAATRWAMAWLNSRPNEERESGCDAGCVLPPAIGNEGDFPSLPEHEDDSWWNLKSTLAGQHPISGENLSSQPRGQWLIEEIHYVSHDDLPDLEGIGYYRILSRGLGKQASSVAVSESIVARPWGAAAVPARFPPGTGSSTFCQQFDDETDCGRLAWRQRR